MKAIAFLDEHSSSGDLMASPGTSARALAGELVACESSTQRTDTERQAGDGRHGGHAEQEPLRSQPSIPDGVARQLVAAHGRPELALAALVGIPFTAGFSAIALVVPLVWAPIRWFTNRATSYELTSQRLRIYRGILNRRLDELELYRVKDYVLEQPLFLRLLGLGNLTLLSSDASTPTVAITAIAGAESVREKLRNAVQTERDRKRVRALDVDESAPLE